MLKFTLKSKTHIFGAALGVFGALATWLPTVRDMIPADWYSYLFIGTSIAVIILRNVTTLPIEAK